MFKTYLKDDKDGLKVFKKAAKKFSLEPSKIHLVSYDSFFGATIYMLAISDKKLCILSTDNKEPEIFDLSEFNGIFLEKKTDLNLSLRNGRVINLTSVVGVKTSVAKQIENINENIKALQ